MNPLQERLFDRREARADPSCWTASSNQGVVATAHYLATWAGVEMLRKGGNAIDAAAAASFALGVCEPAGSGIGGMAVMTVHLPSTSQGDQSIQPAPTFTIEGPCLAPRHASAEIVAQAANRYRGYQAIAVPTAVATMNCALRNYGTMSAAEVLQPAIHLAEEGYVVTPYQHQLINNYSRQLSQQNGRAFFLNDGNPYQPGENFRQPILANTLRRLADAGLEDFYTGDVAARICADMARSGGFLGKEDLANIPQPKVRAPLTGRFADASLHTVGPPAGGLALLQLAHLYTALGRKIDLESPRDAVLLVTMIRKVRQDRRRFRLKTATDDVGNAAAILQMDYAETTIRQMLASLNRHELESENKPFAAREVQDLEEPGETTHVSIIDRFGNAVALTQSVERSFGSAVASPDLGFLYNGYLRAFKVENKRHPHYLKPGAPARSNAAPTILLREGKPWAIIGSSGSERMASAVMGTLIRLQNNSPFHAVHAPRLHCTPESQVLLEADRFPTPVLDELSGAGFEVQRYEPYAFKFGGLQLVASHNGAYCGVADPRRDGAAMAVDNMFEATI